MVRGSGPVVAAAVAMLEQQQQQHQIPVLGLRRVGAVSVLPRASSDPPSNRPISDSSDYSNDGDDDKQTSPNQGKYICFECFILISSINIVHDIYIDY